MKLIIHFAIAFLFTTTHLRAEQPPETIAQAQLAALRVSDWKQFTAYMHPRALVRFKDLMAPIATAVTASQDVAAKKAHETLFGGLPLDRIQASPPELFFERFMENFAKMNPQFVEGYKKLGVEFVGHVKEGGSVHVVVRYMRDVGGAPISEMSASTFQRDQGEWRAVLSPDLEKLAAGLRAQFVK